MYTNTNGGTALEKEVVRRLTETWNSRVAVRKERLDMNQYYDSTIPDFPVSMVPFWAYPEFTDVDESTRLRVLCGAWIMYNEKTIFVEEEIVNPFCRLLLRGELPGVSDPEVKKMVAQTMVDEQFHVLMCLEVCNSGRSRRHLEQLAIPEPLLIRSLNRRLAQIDDCAERALVRMAYAIVAEQSINAYLRNLSSDRTIQPLNRINTDLHRMDEGAHSVIFRQLGLSVFRSLAEKAKESFKRYIVMALGDFTELDNSGWQAVLRYLDIPKHEAIIAELDHRSRGQRAVRDYAALRNLLDALGVSEDIAFEFA